MFVLAELLIRERLRELGALGRRAEMKVLRKGRDVFVLRPENGR